MIVFIAQNMAPIMFASLIIFLLFGYPVAFSLAANGLLFFFIGVELAPLSGGSINLSWPLLTALPDRSSIRPMNVKNGIASSVSFDIVPQKRSGSA